MSNCTGHKPVFLQSSIELEAGDADTSIISNDKLCGGAIVTSTKELQVMFEALFAAKLAKATTRTPITLADGA